MVEIGRLPKEQRIKIARLSGTAKRFASGRDDGDPVAALREISTDPMLLGMAAASSLVDTERSPRDQHAPRALQYLREAGADETALAGEAERVRYRRDEPLPEPGRVRKPGQPPTGSQEYSGADRSKSSTREHS